MNKKTFKCSCCEKELPINNFWKLKSPIWELRKELEKPYHFCSNCCKELLINKIITIDKLCKDLDIPYIEYKLKSLLESYGSINKIIGRYITFMHLRNWYFYGYKDSEKFNNFFTETITFKDGEGIVYVSSMHLLKYIKYYFIFYSLSNRLFASRYRNCDLVAQIAKTKGLN